MRDMLKAKAKDLGVDFQPNIPTNKLLDLVNEHLIDIGEDMIEPEVKEVKEAKVVKSELVEDYYESHPNRLVKLKGLMSRTTDAKEQIKVYSMIRELEG